MKTNCRDDSKNKKNAMILKVKKLAGNQFEGHFCRKLFTLVPTFSLIFS